MFKYKIEEILEALKPHDKEFTKADIKEYSLVLSVEEQKILLDYITNLQEELKYQKEMEEEYNKKHTKLIQKYTNLQEVLDKIKEYVININDSDYTYSQDKIAYNILELLEEIK